MRKSVTFASAKEGRNQRRVEAPLSRAHVLVDLAGTLEEMGDSRGRRVALETPQIADYARGLMRTNRDRLRFILIDCQKRWLSVDVEVERSNVVGPRARVCIEQIEPPFGLTPRELDVLTLMAAGLGNTDIADRLSVSSRTVTKHVENVLTKTSSWTRAGAAGVAIDLGYLRLPTPGGRALLPLTIGMVERAVEAKGWPSGQATQLRPVCRRPIIIGAPISLSSFACEDGVEMLNGAELAVEEINARGGIDGREVQIMVVDCDVSDSQSVLDGHRALMEAEVDAISAGYSSSQVEVQELLTNYRAPYLHAATMDLVVDRVRQEPTRLGHFFQVCPSDINYGPGMARFLIDLEKTGSWKPRSRQIAVLQPEWRGMDVGIRDLERLVAPRGWQVEVIDGLTLKNVNWSSVLSRLKGIDPSVIFLAYYFIEESVAFQRVFQRSPLPALIYTLYGPSVPAYTQMLGPAAEGVIWAATTGSYSDRIAQGFISRYQQRYNLLPGRSHASLAYDRIMILANAWARIGNPRAFGKIVEDLRATVHRGVNGAYVLGTDGQVGLGFPYDTSDPSIGQAHLVFQIQNGTHRILSPAPYCDGSFELPPWMQISEAGHNL